MESSHLVKAHDHAQRAAAATRKSSDTTVAINEHTQAAGEFANAANTTSSAEALRTLKLLEEHHRRLAELLKLPADPVSQTGDEDINEKDASGKEAVVKEKDGQETSAGTGKPVQMPSLGQQRRYASREMSSSIASNLASARGIRSKYRGQPLSPSISNDQAPGDVDARPRNDGSRSKMQTIIDQQSGKPSWAPPISPAAAQRESTKTITSPKAPSSPNASDDVGYARFYNTFGSLINKISAPLAFAGLPLIQEESNVSEQTVSSDTSAASATASKPPSRTRMQASTIADPDLSKIYSKATMRALAREGHSATDSFYVVPTSGHTMSYANILNYAEKEKRRLEASSHGSVGGSIEEEEEDFVDARETPVPLSPGAKRRVGRARTERDLTNTIEELHTENKSLKDMLDKLTKRLHAFEASAQNPAMALAESYRFMRPDSPLSSRGGTINIPSPIEELSKKKQQDLEDKLATSQTLNDQLEKDNKKMQKTLEKYREKWEVLKAGAKARREAQGGGDHGDDPGQS